MSKKDFQYSFPNIDMKELYQKMLSSGKEWPEVIVVNEIEDGSEILINEIGNGNCIIYLKYNPNIERMFACLTNYIETGIARKIPAVQFERHRLSNEEVMIWISCACKIANLLNVRCPQILFIPMEDAMNSTESGVMFLPDLKPYDRFNIILMFINIAHEFRHEWQHVNHPEWFEGYVIVESENDLDAYFNHKTEIDAEAYARKLAGNVFDIHFNQEDFLAFF